MGDTKYLVYYVSNGFSRIRTFPNKGIMDRWIRKFKRDNDGNDDYWIEFVATGVQTFQVYSHGVKVVNYGE